MYIIKNKVRQNIDKIIKEIKIINDKTETYGFNNEDTKESVLDLGGPDVFKEKTLSKDYFTRKLGFQAELVLARVAKDRYKKEYKNLLDKRYSIDIMASEQHNIVGVLLRKNNKLIIVLENWELVEKEKNIEIR